MDNRVKIFYIIIALKKEINFRSIGRGQVSEKIKV